MCVHVHGKPSPNDQSQDEKSAYNSCTCPARRRRDTVSAGDMSIGFDCMYLTEWRLERYRRTHAINKLDSPRCGQTSIPSTSANLGCLRRLHLQHSGAGGFAFVDFAFIGPVSGTRGLAALPSSALLRHSGASSLAFIDSASGTRGLALCQQQVHRCTRHATRVPSSALHHRFCFAGLMRDSGAKRRPRHSTPAHRFDSLRRTSRRRLRPLRHPRLAKIPQ